MSSSDGVIVKVGNTAFSVLQLLPDIRAAMMDESATAAAQGEFCSRSLKLVVTWLDELLKDARLVIGAGAGAMQSVKSVVQALRDTTQQALPGMPSPAQPYSLVVEVPPAPPVEQHDLHGEDAGGGAGDADRKSAGSGSTPSSPSSVEVDLMNEQMASLSMGEVPADKAVLASAYNVVEGNHVEPPARRPAKRPFIESSDTAYGGTNGVGGNQHQHTRHLGAGNVASAGATSSAHASVTSTAMTMGLSSSAGAKSLQWMQRVDRLLEQHALFWVNLEAALNVLQQRTTHLESLISFSIASPSLKQRFVGRIDEYGVLWHRVVGLCNQYVATQQAFVQQQHQQPQQPPPPHQQPPPPDGGDLE